MGTVWPLLVEPLQLFLLEELCLKDFQLLRKSGARENLVAVFLFQMGVVRAQRTSDGRMNDCQNAFFRTLLGTPGIATRSKNATGNKCIASSNKCLTSSNKDATRDSWHRY